MVAKPKVAKADEPAPVPPDIIAFDMVETLFSLSSLEPLFVAAGGDASTLRLWVAQVLADGFALSAARSFTPFRDVAKATLAALLPKAKAAARDRVLAGLTKLDVLPDAAAAMGRTVMNAQVTVITNTSADTARRLMAHGGLDTFADPIFTADQVKRWKPASDLYAFAAATLDVPLARMAMVTVHPWDVLGAHQSGLVTGWCNREGATFPPAFGKPDVTGRNLVEVVEALFALKAPPPG
ncbi:MAG TPA: HAD-IA family hydrolase [Acidimicrobiales bacterium]|nr:HAD-IA family hydrolase [Acidimicrobiales bacterium]